MSWASIVKSTEKKCLAIQEENDRKKEEEKVISQQLQKEKRTEELWNREMKLHEETVQRDLDKKLQMNGRFKFVNLKKFFSDEPVPSDRRNPILFMMKKLDVSEDCAQALWYNMQRSRGTLEYLRELVEIDRLVVVTGKTFDWYIPLRGESFQKELDDLRQVSYI